ncbi:TonB-dependent receptor plug domain-containing protein [Parabacteroides chongii]|uniref:TonB-dependent receptor plug domain-containing protein n=1 Tax=Parabacteroides chongii TaxID=2685834 RepID=UPI00240DCF99|nr:TonB-dependent receptor [Parabacteroides chongii]WFE86582.1 TonB-dependent receptor [Parabacteroides chongii]
MRTLYVKMIVCLFGILLCVPAVYAQTIDTTAYHQLKGVEVVEKARPSTTREAAPLQVMDRAGIERLGIQDLSEAVKRFSGATVKDYGGIGGLKTVSVRSLGAQHTAVSYDGVTITDAQSGQVDISRFSLDNVEMVSLSIGQTDDIFQTARMYASAGALSVKTSSPDFTSSPFHLKAQLKAGSFGLVNPYLRYEQKFGKKWYASWHGDYLRADGNYPFTLVNGDLVEKKKRNNSDIESWRTELNFAGDLGKAGTLSMKGYYFDSHRGLPGSVILYNDYSGERLWDRNAFAQARYENRITEKFALQAQAKYNYSWMRHLDVDNKYESGRQDDRYTQKEYYLSVSGLYSLTDHLSFSLAEDYFINTLDNTIPECPFPKRYTSLTALAAQYKDTRLTATASLLGTYITEKVERGDKPSDRKRLSPAVSLSWRVMPEYNFRLRASYKDIFRVPTFNDLYYLRMGNTNLKPERATQYNLGMTWSGSLPFINYLNAFVDGYYNRVSDKIVAIPTMFIWKMMNMGEVSIGGIDVNLSAEVPLWKNISLSGQASYSWQHAIDITDGTEKNYRDQIPYTPRHSGNVSVAFQMPWVNVSYLLTVVGDRYASPQNIGRNLIDRYAEQTISLNRSFTFASCSLRLQFDIINVGNINYDVIKYYPMPGRSFRGGLVFVY